MPFAIPAVPDAGLLGLGGAGDPSRIHVLRDADVGDAGRLVSHQVDVGVQDRRVHGLAVPGPHWRGDSRGSFRQGKEFGWRLPRAAREDVGRGDAWAKLSAWRS